jgi:hypothetical protein
MKRYLGLVFLMGCGGAAFSVAPDDGKTPDDLGVKPADDGGSAEPDATPSVTPTPPDTGPPAANPPDAAPTMTPDAGSPPPAPDAGPEASDAACVYPVSAKEVDYSRSPLSYRCTAPKDSSQYLAGGCDLMTTPDACTCDYTCDCIMQNANLDQVCVYQMGITCHEFSGVPVVECP